MNLKIDKHKIVVITSLVLIIALGLSFLFRNMSNSHAINTNIEKSKKFELIVNNIKTENSKLELEYESSNIPEFKSIVFKDNNRYKSFIIDNDGKELTFKDLIKENKWEDYLRKENELLALKYPNYIQEGIKNNKDNKGIKVYYLKDNEVIVYYYDYVLDYETANLNLKINYNEIKDFINFTPVANLNYKNEDGFKYDPNKMSVAITFDDGPSSKYNALILEELNKNKSRATFFMVGRMMEDCQKCVLATYKAGHEVASHTYEHMNIKNKTPEEAQESINKVNDLYTKITGDNIKYLRPPYGSYSKENLKNINLPFILWDLDTEDWRYKDVNHIVNYVLENISDGSIILMHELYETSYEALKILLPKLYSLGYQVVSIGDLANLKNITLEVGKSYNHLN